MAGKNLVQLLLNEPAPTEFNSENVTDYIRRLMLKMSSENILNNISLDEAKFKSILADGSILSDLLGEGLEWSSGKKIDFSVGSGLAYNSGTKKIDVTKGYTFNVSSLTSDLELSTSYQNYVEQQITAPIGATLDISIVATLDTPADSAWLAEYQVCIGTDVSDGTTLVHQVVHDTNSYYSSITPLCIRVIADDIAAADPYIRFKAKSNEASKTTIKGATYTGQFSVIVFT